MLLLLQLQYVLAAASFDFAFDSFRFPEWK